MALDIDAVRAETPGCEHVVHLNNAGSSLPPATVVETVIEYLRAEAVTGGYEIARDRDDQLAAVYQRACDLFGGRAGLGELAGVTLTDKGAEKSALVTFTVAGHQPETIRQAMRDNGINISTSTSSSARLDFPDRGLEQVARASVHYFNTETEIDALVGAIDELATA